MASLEQNILNALQAHVELEQAAPQLIGVPNLVSSLSFFGMRGAKVLHLNRILPVIARYGPDVLLVDIGSNDLAQGAQPARVAASVEQWVKEATRVFPGVICLLSVVPRATALGNMTPEQFLNSALELEALLKLLPKSHNNVLYHKHKGFYEREEEQGVKSPLIPYAWSHDGIHPNNQLGRKKYKNLLRLAIAKCYKHLQSQRTPLNSQ